MPRWLLLLSCLSGLALAQPAKLVTGPNYPPFTDTSLPDGGLAVSLVKQVMNNANLPYQLDWRPWTNGYQSTLKGEYLATFPYISTPERRELFEFSDPLFILEIKVFALPGSQLDGTQLNSLQGKRYCHPLGWAFLKEVELMVNKGLFQMIRPYDMSSCIRLIAEDKADFILTDQIQGNEAIAQVAGLKKTPVASGGIVEKVALRLMVKKNQPQSHAFLLRFNEALKTIRPAPHQSD
ncbi:transporter substrate-binding domain-containing protein [Iodobacter sp. CM08]|uniref:substrate-binding periplasmic protein n=1 Tax=Iodobacter sp. CM08 TaxID=3085902 RepID=UPI00298294C7|nr:transporter substrate-binding domain-containing protein [Iodobacter sp. CM08]MDW5415580.1 transporter substrate-binding domain-containing protein [Iodobacter sp. CM08]